MSPEALQSYINKVEAIDMEKIAHDVILAYSDLIVKVLKTQLTQGVNGLDEPITINGNYGYSNYTVEVKERYGEGLGKVTDRVTLYMTGLFYELIEIQINETSFDITSGVPYYQDIIQMSGKSVMELSPISAEFLKENYIIPTFKKQVQIALENAKK